MEQSPLNTRNASSYTDEEEEIISFLDGHISTGMSFARAAEMCNLRSADIASLHHRKEHVGYMRREEWHAQCIGKLAEWRARESIPNDKPRSAQTPTWKSIHDAIGTIWEEAMIGAIIGGYGVGKTIAEKDYCFVDPRVPCRSGAVYIEFSAAEAGASATIRRLCRAFFGDADAYSKDVALANLERVVSPANILIADEVNALGDGLTVLRALHDRTGMPIVLSGNPDMKRAIWEQKSGSLFGALISRLVPYEFMKTTEKDVLVFAEWEGVTDERLIDAMIAVGTGKGAYASLRTVARCLRLARRNSEQAGTSLASAFRSHARAFDKASGGGFSGAREGGRAK